MSMKPDPVNSAAMAAAEEVSAEVPAAVAVTAGVAEAAGANRVGKFLEIS